MRPYMEVPIGAAKFISESYDKDVVVVLTISTPHDRWHVTTFGRSADDKLLAARLGDVVPTMLNLDAGSRRLYEDFRTTKEAEWRVEKDQLENKVKRLEKELLQCLENR